VNGTFRQTLTLSSAQTWGYEGNNHYNNESQNPSDGNPRTFFDDVHTFVTGTAIAPGNTFRLQKNSGNTATFYYVDVIDVENPAAALTQPANSLPITSYGAVANDSNADNTSAIQNCINAAQSQGKSVWIPSGTFYIKSLGGLNANGITIQGAGMWRTRFVGKGGRLRMTGGTVHLAGFAIFGETTIRNDTSQSDNAFDGIPGADSLIERIWVEHTKCAYWVAGATRLRISGCRFRDLMADGVNFCGGVHQSTLDNNQIRNSGDDSLAAFDNGRNTIQSILKYRIIF